MTGAATQSATATAQQGLIVTPHPLATEAGAEVLRQGGTAIEAIVAAGAVLTVVCPHFCGLGGDGVWLISDREGRRVSVAGLGQAAGGVVADNGPIPERGADAALTTAGLVPGWEAILSWALAEWGAGFDVADLLEPAEAYARSGYPVSDQQIFWTRFRDSEFGNWPDVARIFLANGQPPQKGTVLRQPQLAETFAALGRDGLGSFSHGALASRVAQGLEAAGSPLRAEDFARTRVAPEPPLRLALDGLTLFAPPPPTQGLTTLTIMGVLDRLTNIGQATDADRLHLQVEAVKQAFLHRGGIADPRCMADAPALPTSAEFQRIASKIDPTRALPWHEPYRSADTVFLAASDNKGRSVSALQSTYFDWGAGIVAGDTGIVWNNRGAAFSPDPASPNHLAPGKRPFHTLNPGLAVWADDQTLLYGTQGADGQPQTLAVLLTEVIHRGRSPAEALARPRFLLGRTFSDPHASLKIESDVDDGALAVLAERGHDLSPLPPLSPIAGQAGMILVSGDGEKRGAHDPRGDGSAQVA